MTDRHRETSRERVAAAVSGRAPKLMLGVVVLVAAAGAASALASLATL